MSKRASFKINQPVKLSNPLSTIILKLYFAESMKKLIYKFGVNLNYKDIQWGEISEPICRKLLPEGKKNSVWNV